MKLLTLRGLAALALLCLLPRASALDITYSKTTNIQAHASGGASVKILDSLTFSKPAASGDPLAAIIVDYFFTGEVFNNEFNNYGQPVRYTPQASVYVEIAAKDPLNAIVGSAGDQIRSPTIILPNLATSSIHGPVEFRVSQQISDQSTLNRFYGDGTGFLTMNFGASGNNFYGLVNVVGSATTRLTFVHTVPDAINPMVATAVAICLIGLIHRLRIAWFPRMRKVGGTGLGITRMPTDIV